LGGHPGKVEIVGSIVLGAASAALLLGDYCSGTIWSFKAGNGRLSAPHVEGKIEGLSSFGEDGNGELYATSLGGTVSRLMP
jgi:hypothetical protein